ncbi:MAG: hypothetical protein ACRDGG_04495 [Anaerolineae bacterium]
MNGRIVLGVVLVLVLIAGAVGIGTYVYNAGVAQGLAESGKLVAPESGAVPYPYYGPFYRPFGFGFGFLGLLFPLLFLFLVFGLLRRLFWRGGWGGGGPRGNWEKGVPPMFEEWHRRAHEPQSTEK